MVSHNALNPEKSTLVIQPFPGIENMVSHLRALKAIARYTPNHKITLLCRSDAQAEALFGHESWIQEIITIDQRYNLSPFGGILLGKKLKEYNFHTAWILHHSPRYYIACSFAGIRIRYGFGFGWLKDLLTSPLILARSDKKLHPCKKSEKLLAVHKIEIHEQDHQLTGCASSESHGLPFSGKLKKPWIVFGIGASHPLRIWPAGKYAALAVELSKKEECTILVCGLPSEQHIAEEIQQEHHAQRINIKISLNSSLKETIDLLAQCQYFIGNDSGLLSIAAALGVPSIGIFPALGPQLYTLCLFDTVLAYQKQRALPGIKDIEVTDVLDAFLRLKEA